jgi:hypothetical protein
MCHRTFAHGRCLPYIFCPLDDAILADVFRPWTKTGYLQGWFVRERIVQGTHHPRDASSKNKRSGTHRSVDGLTFYHRRIIQVYFAVVLKLFFHAGLMKDKKKSLIVCPKIIS